MILNNINTEKTIFIILNINVCASYVSILLTKQFRMLSEDTMMNNEPQIRMKSFR